MKAVESESADAIGGRRLDDAAANATQLKKSGFKILH
jgi:hypothetical protein